MTNDNPKIIRMDDGREYFAAIDAAHYLRISRQRVSQLCKQGRFTPFYVGATVLIPVNEIFEYDNEAGTPARTPGPNPKEV